MKRGLLAFSFCVFAVVASKANDTLTRTQVYNFSVGDTFEYEYHYGPANGCIVPIGDGYYLEIIKNISYSPGSDTLYVERERHTITVTTSHVDTITHLLEYEIFQDSCMPTYLQITPNAINGRTYNEVQYGACGGGITERYAYGLGEIYSYYVYESFPVGCFAYNEIMLHYYSKQGETWGTFVNIISGFSAVEKGLRDFRISPNPATTGFTISIDENLLGSTATITDLTGREIANTKLQTLNTKLETGSLTDGIYFVTISTGTQSATRKLIVSK